MSETLPEFLLADNADFPDAIFVVHTHFPRFIINLTNDDLEWWETFSKEDSIPTLAVSSRRVNIDLICGSADFVVSNAVLAEEVQ